MYGGDCDAAIAKTAAAVTHVQSQSQEVGSGDGRAGLVVFCLGYSVLDAGLSCTKGVWYVYGWDTGLFILMYWEVSTGLSPMLLTPSAR